MQKIIDVKIKVDNSELERTVSLAKELEEILERLLKKQDCENTIRVLNDKEKEEIIKAMTKGLRNSTVDLK